MALPVEAWGRNDSHNSYGSEDFEQELPGESSSVPLQHQVGNRS